VKRITGVKGGGLDLKHLQVLFQALFSTLASCRNSSPETRAIFDTAASARLSHSSPVLKGLKLVSMDDRSQVEALNRSQMVVTFSVDASVLSANSLFLNAFGVSLEEVNRMFAQDADSDAYRQLWEGLRSGMSQVRGNDVFGPQKSVISI
jgi:hypothetical protein